MKLYSSLKTKKNRDKDCKIVRRKGRIFVINKKNPKFKACQGSSIDAFQIGSAEAELFLCRKFLC